MYPFEFYLPALHASAMSHDPSTGAPTASPARPATDTASGRGPRRRRTTLAALCVLLLVAAGTGGVAASGAWSGRTPDAPLSSDVSVGHAHPARQVPHLLSGPGSPLRPPRPPARA